MHLKCLIVERQIPSYNITEPYKRLPSNLWKLSRQNADWYALVCDDVNTLEILHMEQLCHILPLCSHRLMCVWWSWYQQSFVGKGQASWLRLGASWTMRTWKLQKKRCTDALDLHENPDKLVLVVKGAMVDQSAFRRFMASFTAQQRAHFSEGIDMKVMDVLRFLSNIGCYFHIIL